MGGWRPVRMVWHDLLFLHRRVAVEALRPLVPDGLTIDTFEGEAWLGVVPFRMTRVGARFLPPIPGLSAFPELNVRTYVVRDGRPGVWFFSLDAARRLAVRVARRAFHLPYRFAAMVCRREGDDVVYASERREPDARPAGFRARYGPTGPAYRARPGDLDHWLTERYGLYAARPDGALRWVAVEHEPWPLQPAHATVETDTMAAAAGLEPSGAAVLHFARRLDVVSGLPEPV